MRKIVMLGLIVGMATGAFAVPKGFVYCKDRHFVLNNRIFYYGGTNLAEFFLVSKTRMDNMVKQCREHNVHVVRCWGFGNGTGWKDPEWVGDGYSLQPKLGVYNDTAFRRIDYALAKAGENNLRVIFVLVNNWPNWYHGDHQWYVDQRLGSGKPNSLFYTDASVKQDFKNYIKYVVNRVNSITGIPYSQDSAIFCWQLCNEPRNRGASDGEVLYKWVNEIAGYIKSLDSNHMVSTGEEGGGTAGNFNPTGSEDGVDFKKNTACQHIDYACIHIYPTHWGFSSFEKCYTYLANRLKIVRELGKPAALEEFGTPRNGNAPWTESNRPYTYSQWLIKTTTEYDFDGFNVWQMSDINSIKNPTGEQENWDFDFSSTLADTIKKYCIKQENKSGEIVDPSSIISSSANKKASRISIKGGNGAVSLTLSDEVSGPVRIRIFDVFGKCVRTIYPQYRGNGTGTVTFTDIPSGACFYAIDKIKSGASHSGKFVMIR